jgi:outer membrane protein TolC
VTVSEALVERPEIKARLAEVEAREAAVRLRERDFYPDFEVTASYNSMWGNSEHRWIIGLGIDLPIRRDRLHAASAEAAAALKQAQSERSALEDAVRTEVFVARERLGEAEHVVELYRSRLLPASEDQIRAARTGFETGQNSFLVLIEAERNQRSVRLGFEEALTDFSRRRAELDRAMGKIPALSAGRESEGGSK